MVLVPLDTRVVRMQVTAQAGKAELENVLDMEWVVHVHHLHLLLFVAVHHASQIQGNTMHVSEACVAGS